MHRRLEAEVMDIPERAEAYARADFAEVNAAFVERVLELAPDRASLNLLDLGTGPGDNAIAIAELRPNWRVHAVDASLPMLRLAQSSPPNSCLLLADATRLPHADASFDGVVSNSLLHHLPNPAPLWSEIARVLRPGGFLLLRDLLRPDSEATARAIVDIYAANEHPFLKDDFYHSLLAAFSLDEIRDMLDVSPLSRLHVEQISDRHVDIWGMR